MNSNTVLSETHWRTLLNNVLWNNMADLVEKEKAATSEANLIEIIREHVADGITEENIDVLQRVANFFFYVELSGVFWYYSEEMQCTLLDAFPAFDPFTACDAELFTYHPHEHLMKIVQMRRTEFVLAHAMDFGSSDVLTRLMIAI